MSQYNQGLLGTILTKRKVFVSYHHGNDQAYYNEFSRVFSGTYDVIQDNSLDRAIDSTNTDYVMRKIREEYLTGTSCTIVLCGPQTYQRKYVDWEINATLDKRHGLIGVRLPTLLPNTRGYVVVPDRLNDNIHSDYAVWIGWESLITPGQLARNIEQANNKSAALIINNRPMKSRNG